MYIDTSYGLISEKYHTFRPKYPETLFRTIFSELTDFNIAIDLGAGTGLGTLPLCEKFAKIIAVEPDEQLLNYGLRTNNNQKIFGIAQTSEEFETINDSVDLVTCGRAFHWMDGDLVVRKVYNWLKKDGVFAIFGYVKTIPGFPDKIGEIVLPEYQNNWNGFKNQKLARVGEGNYNLRTVENFGEFSTVKVIQIPYLKTFNAYNFIGYFSTLSYVSNYLKSIPNPQQYLEELLLKIKKASDGQDFSVDFELKLIIAKK